ncbi:MAG TPA: hypothetical protein VFM99_07600 [Chitinophagales bacterium]|nr:hypothetical protein [Chitinophagales bacterium]
MFKNEEAIYKGGVNERRKRALSRLEAQLKIGTKPEKNLHKLTLATTGGYNFPLTAADIHRIEKEISILKSLIK